MIGPVGAGISADEVRSFIGVQDEFEAAVRLVQRELALDNRDDAASVETRYPVPGASLPAATSLWRARSFIARRQLLGRWKIEK